MDVQDVIEYEFETFDESTRVAKLRGVFRDPKIKALPITRGGELLGLVTRRDVMSSHEAPSRKAGSLARSVPTVSPTEDVREAARLMITGDTPLLPVIEDETLVGVLQADDLLYHVRTSLDALDVVDIATTTVVSIVSDTPLGRTLASFREYGLRHLPVLDEPGGDLGGIVSLHDILEFVTREEHRAQGGEAPIDRFGAMDAGHQGGFGAREGEREDVLGLPVRNVMVEPVLTTGPDRPVDELLDDMLTHDVSSMIVLEDDRLFGIVTKTDILESLTWTDEQPYNIHVFGAELMSETTWEKLSDRIAKVVRKDRRLNLLEAKIHFHHHKEQLRGKPYVLARIRLFTDQGVFVGSGEGFGDRHAFSLALDTIERQLLDAKTYDQAKRDQMGAALDAWDPVEAGNTGE